MKEYNETRKQDESIRDDIGYISRREYAERSFPKLIDLTQCQEDIDKEIINSLHSYKHFSKYLSNE
jgi:hypothetical protein